MKTKLACLIVLLFGWTVLNSGSAAVALQPGAKLLAVKGHVDKQADNARRSAERERVRMQKWRTRHAREIQQAEREARMWEQQQKADMKRGDKDDKWGKGDKGDRPGYYYAPFSGFGFGGFGF